MVRTLVAAEAVVIVFAAVLWTLPLTRSLSISARQMGMPVVAAASSSSPAATAASKRTRSGSMSGGLLQRVPPILSTEMVAHVYEYKPRGFTIAAHRLSATRVLVEFNYTTPTARDYTRYIIRMRYHNERREYATNKSTLDRHAPNRIYLNRFPHAAYVLCVTLFPGLQAASGNGYYLPAISTSDMCVDLVFGEEHRVADLHHNRTGLLAPVLLALVALCLVLISVIHGFKLSACIDAPDPVGDYTPPRNDAPFVSDYSFNQLVGLQQPPQLEQCKLTNMLLHYDDQTSAPPPQQQQQQRCYQSTQRRCRIANVDSTYASPLYKQAETNMKMTPTQLDVKPISAYYFYLAQRCRADPSS